jgi:hypothetical protein
MNRLTLWVTAAFSGGIVVLMTSLGLIASLSILLLAVLLALRSRDRAVAVSGVLTGFGAIWSFLMVGQAGIVPLVVGCALVVPTVVRTLRSRQVAGG